MTSPTRSDSPDQPQPAFAGTPRTRAVQPPRITEAFLDDVFEAREIRDEDIEGIDITDDMLALDDDSLDDDDSGDGEGPSGEREPAIAADGPTAPAGVADGTGSMPAPK